jgi:2-succinyl-5-enolpyruvyl-6-hydroxy-3-cyclohexene-1-carboxylate synthase
MVERAIPEDRLTEARIVRTAVEVCPRDSVLVLGNSMPVRDADTYCPASPRPLRVIHQRGASGIDGLVSGALGALSVAQGPLTLILGDISLLHDLSALHLARAVPGPMVIVVVQNGGGRIFDHLPIAEGAHAEHFERYFAMPQDVSFSDAARAFGISYARAEVPSELAAALTAAWANRGASLIEAVVPPRDGALRASALWSQVAAEAF